MTVRVVHLDPATFGDLTTETAILEDRFGDPVVEAVDGEPSGAGPADLLLTLSTPVDAAALDAVGPSAVGVYATGVDFVDVGAATERGVPVSRVPSYCDREVAQHAMAMALSLLRGLPRYDADTAAGGWDWTLANPLREWGALTAGFLAFGRKARAAARIADALGFDVLAHDPHLDDDEVEAGGATPVGFDALLESSDVLSVHTPLTADTEGLLDADALAKLPEGAVLVNTSRGRVIEESALLAALEDGPLAGAGLDVLAEEPPDPANPLLGRDDVIVTPHAAWNSEGAIERLRTRGTQNAVRAFDGERFEGLVNPDALA